MDKYIWVIVFIMVVGLIFILYTLSRRERGVFNIDEIIEANKNLKSYKVYFLGWVVEYSNISVERYYVYHDKFTWISPTWYIVDINGNVVEHTYIERLVNMSRKWGVKIVPLIANKNFDPDIVHNILRNSSLMNKTIKNIVDIVLERNYDGINIDFEGIPAEDREYFTLFLKYLSIELHKYNKVLTVDVPAKTYDVKEGWSGAFDYKEIGKYCDLVILMIYDYHWSGGNPGPISPLSWFNNVLEYALKTIPREKIVAGIPFYGYDWPISGRGRGVTYSQALKLAEKYGCKIFFDKDSGEAYFKYSYRFEHHEVWFNIAKSSELRIKSALEKGIDKIAAWRIGQEDPETWKVIEKP